MIKNQIIVSLIKEKIQELVEKINQLSFIENEILKAEESAQSIDFKIRETLELLEIKNSEIEKLQSFSVKGLVSSIFVDKKVELENKRNEYYLLSKQYDSLKAEKAASDFELEIINRKINDFGLMKQELQVLMNKRESELLKENSNQGMALANVHKETEALNLKLKKLNTSLELSDSISSKLTLFSAALRDVETSIKWKGRRQFGWERNNKEVSIRKAKEFNVESRLMLNDLSVLLREIGLSYKNLDVVLVTFENEFGMLFENFISDMIMKKRIIEGVENIEFVFQNLKKVKFDISEKIKETQAKRDRLFSMKDKLLKE